MGMKALLGGFFIVCLCVYIFFYQCPFHARTPPPVPCCGASTVCGGGGVLFFYFFMEAPFVRVHFCTPCFSLALRLSRNSLIFWAALEWPQASSPMPQVTRVATAAAANPYSGWRKSRPDMNG
jgi:hypothetical protein